jgi:predicted O-linked N-acetylglucosamine transferase (SPINDLY family)
MTGAADLVAQGWNALRAGQAAEAERLGLAATQADPAAADGWYLLGTARHFQRRPADALDCYTRALTLRPEFPEVLLNLATGLQELDRPAEAVPYFQRALRLRPDFPELHNNYGNTLRGLDRLADAEESFRQAIRLRPDYPEAYANLGNTLSDMGRRNEAEGYFREVLRLRPASPEILNNLGSILCAQGRMDEAEECFRQALKVRPDDPDVLINLGNLMRILERPGEEECYRRAVAQRPDLPDRLVDKGNTLHTQGRLTEAIWYFRQAARIRPDLPEAQYNLGNALHDQRRLDEAADCYRKALGLRPDYAEAQNNLGVCLRDLGRPDQALDHLRRALALRPDFPEGLINLGNALHDLNQLSEAETHYRRVLALRPDHPEAHNNLGNNVRAQGRVGEAEACFRRALELRPSYVDAHDALLQTLHYRPGVTPQELAAEHAEYQRRHAAPLRPHWQPHTNTRDPDRPLRLGFVSPDFAHHPVGFLLIRGFEALARRPDTVLCYSERRSPPDELTARFRAAAAVWRETGEMTDDALAARVRADGIDVLIDLAGHTGGNRLLAFARKPAPVQMTWLGYEGGTGLEAIDYLIADERVVPPGAEAHYRERVLRLRGGYATYDPLDGAPEPGPPPALAGGRVTFGCFNNPAKLSPPALAAFAAVLNRVPGSRLLLKYRGLDDPVIGGWLRERLAAAGVPLDRVELRRSTAPLDYLAAYNEVDAALDPFPFGGGVTTCDALWMGVPVVTLPGPTFASRHGLSYSYSAGLADELAARDVEDYVARAAALVQDLGRLAEMRAGQRERIARSPLCDGDRLADELLQAVRGAWREWVTGTEGR